MLSINSPIAEAWNGREVALSKLGLHAEAVNSYDKAIAINPDNTKARENRDIAFQQQETKIGSGAEMTHRDVLNYFSQALEYVRTNGYEKEVEWCRNIPPSEDCTAETFFEEYVWSVLNAGMKEQVARKIYERFMEH